MLFNTRGDGKDIGVEDDVFGREADADQQVIGALADLDLAFLGIRLAGFVECHHDDSGTIGHAQAGVV